MEEKEFERLFEKKQEELNYKNQIEQLKKEFELFKNSEFKELKEATTDTCPQCHKLVSNTAKHCHHCKAEFDN